MRKHGSAVACTFLLAIALFTIFISTRAQNAPPAGAKTAAQQFKNIQIMKDIPAEDLIPSMQFISASLGVECTYCHVEHAFDKDDKKEKKFARHMIEMTMNINKDNFEGKRQVTCYSCHRGAAKPVSIPVISAEERMPEMMAGDATDKSSFPKADALLGKYLASVGGADALMKTSSRVQKGAVSVAGNPKTPIDIYEKAPNKRVSAVRLKGGESLTGFDGKAGWMAVPGRVHMMTPGESEGAQMDADIALPTHLSGMFSKLEVSEGVSIDNHATWLVVGQREGKPDVQLNFDKQSGLLLRLVRYTDSPLGLNPLQIDFADYRDSGGVKIPFRWTQARPGNRFTIQIESSEQNVPIDDAKFAAPSPQPPPPGH
jgi:hypothetical protein